MSNADQPAIADDQRKPPFQFSIAFLLWLTAACAFVLGIAVWTPCFFNPVLAAAIATILTIAYRKDKQALWCSLIFGTATIAVAYGDWLVNVVRLRPNRFDHAGGVFEALFFAIIGLTGGLTLATLPSNSRKQRPPQYTEQPTLETSQDERAANQL
jgi:hypothetical protein